MSNNTVLVDPYGVATTAGAAGSRCAGAVPSSAAPAANGRAPVALVFGAGISGLAAARLLRARGREVILLDEEAPARLDERVSWLGELGIQYYFGSWTPALLDGVSVVVLSPGIPASHILPAEAASRGIPVIGELELGASLAEPPIFAITGTNGKTTTTALLSHILVENGFDAPACGNIGVAFCDRLLEQRETGKSTILVTEVSSYQLETIQTFRPAAAWLLNITPDHLERHGSMAGYQEAKFRVTRNQTREDALALNADDDRVSPLRALTKAQVWEFSAKGRVDRGAYLDGPFLTMCCGNGAEPFPLMRVAELTMRGRHNIENVLAASLVMFFCDLEAGKVSAAIRSFRGVEHRLEFVCEHNGVLYYNDSKATNLDAMAVALESFREPIILIAGGREHGTNWRKILPLVAERVRRVLLIGEAAPRIEEAWGDTIPCERVETLEDAALVAGHRAQRGDAVLLSPGCKSFDMFENFEHRGRVFKKTLMETLHGVDVA